METRATPAVAAVLSSCIPSFCIEAKRLGSLLCTLGYLPLLMTCQAGLDLVTGLDETPAHLTQQDRLHIVLQKAERLL